MRITIRREGGLGLSVGAIFAAYLSWTTWHSLAWVILHGICGWFYVLYWAVTHA